MGQGMCVSSRLPPGEDESSPEDYKPPLGFPSAKKRHSKQHDGGSTTEQPSRRGSTAGALKKKVKVR